MHETHYINRGSKTFVALLILRLIPVVFLSIGVLMLIALKGPITDSLMQLGNSDGVAGEQIYSYILGTALGLMLLLTAVMILIAWIEYISFKYAIEERSFRTRTGIFNLQEMSIPYRHMHNVDVSRPLLYRLLGMSRVEIITAGEDKHDGVEAHDYPNECVIQIIDKEQALMIQHEFLDRSHIQPVQVVPEETTAPHTN